MKKLFLPVSILTIIMVISGILIYQTGTPQNEIIYFYSEIIHVGVIIILFILGIIFAAKRIISGQKGIPEDDELSKRIVQKSAALSFYSALLIWLILLFVGNMKIVDNQLLFGYGFIGMTLVFILSWFVINSKGITDE